MVIPDPCSIVVAQVAHDLFEVLNYSIREFGRGRST